MEGYKITSVKLIIHGSKKRNLNPNVYANSSLYKKNGLLSVLFRKEVSINRIYSYSTCDSKLKLELSDFPYEYGSTQFQIIQGLLLGDGHLRLSKNGEKARYAHTCKHPEPLKDIVDKQLPLIFNTTKLGSYPKSNPSQYTCSSKTYTSLKNLWDLWYKLGNKPNSCQKYTKVLPQTLISEHFSPLLISYWFMNDGYYDGHDKTFLFCTESFSKEEVDFLILLLRKFDLKSGSKKRKDGYRIRLSRQSVLLFKNLISSFMLPVYEYKLNQKI